MNLEMAAFDVAGTTVKDDGIVIEAFKVAFEMTQPDLWPTKGAQWTQYAIDTMGQSKIEVFTTLLGNAEAAYEANIAFEEAYVNEVAEQGISPIPGTIELFAALREKGIPVVLTTGFSRSTLNVLLTELNWFDLVDLTVTPEEAGRGRPHPDMLQFAAQKVNAPSSEFSLVVGDTASDMKSGVAHGSKNIFGVLSGAHSYEQLIAGGATSVVNSVADISSFI
ncbi:MAG: HAD family hydrolase [Actinobacteria bacterium]|nr:HAD family hydrolase [Actinomycetota bacterium]